MAWMALGRLAGVIGFLAFAALAMASFVAGGHVLGLLAGLLATGALGISILADDGMRRARDRRIASMQRASAFAPSMLEADLKAWKTGVALLFLGAVASAFVRLAAAGPLGALVMGSFAVVCLAALMAALAWLVVLRWRAGHVLRIDADGLRSCALPAIPWSQVHGIDLHVVDAKGQIRSTLVLDVDGAWFEAAAWSRWRRILLWPAAQLVPAARLVRLPLAFVDANPQRVLSAAQALADRHGAPWVPKWSQRRPSTGAR